MLTEIRNSRQIPDEPRRRWFHSSDMDLIVWFDNDENSPPIAFQLCYDKAHGEKALSWKAERGFVHADVDDGEGTGGKHKGSPLLVPDGAFDRDVLSRNFAAASGALPDEIRTFVIARLSQAKNTSRPTTAHTETPNPC